MAGEAGYLTLGEPVTTPGGVVVDRIRTMPSITPDTAIRGDEAVDALAGGSQPLAAELRLLNPAIRYHALAALMDLSGQNITLESFESPRRGNMDPDRALDPARYYPDGTALMNDLGLTVRITGEDQPAIDAAMREAGFEPFGDQPGTYAISADPNMAYVYNDMPYWSTARNDFRILPDSPTWGTLDEQNWRHGETGETAAEYVERMFRIDAEGEHRSPEAAAAEPAPAPEPAPDAPTPETAAPGTDAAPPSPDAPATDAPPAAGTEPPATPTGWQRIPNGTTAPEGTDKWVQNGLLGLGVVTEAMSAEERSAAIMTYMQQAGITGTGESGAFTEADLARQVNTDVIAWQTYLSAAPNRGGTTTRYEIGAFRDAEGNPTGIDGRFGDMTYAATQDYARATGIGTPLTILRAPTPAEQLALLDPARAAAAEAAAGMVGVTTDGASLTDGAVPEAAAGEAHRAGPTPASPGTSVTI